MSFARFVVAVGVVILLPAGLLSDVLCTNCFHTFRAPGSPGGGGGAGLYRINGCPCCQPEDCKTAAERAGRVRRTYERLRREYEQLNREVAKLRADGKPVPQSTVSRQANLNEQLGELEYQYAILNANCPKEVPGENVWDGLYEGPVENSPVAQDEATRYLSLLKQAARLYEREMKEARHRIDVINGFLGTAADGFAPPPTGYNGERAQVTRGYQSVADAYRKHAAEVGNEAAADPKIDVAERVAPKFPAVKPDKGGDRNAGIAVQSQLEGNAYTLAYLQARERHRLAAAAGKADAAKAHAFAAVEFAYQARGYANWAATHQHRADAAHQKLLDARLADAAKKGLTLTELLKKFQDGVRASGVPAHLKDALRAAGAPPAELDTCKDRLLALTPEAVEAVLKERREWVKLPENEVQAPDIFLLDSQLAATRRWYHQQAKK